MGFEIQAAKGKRPPVGKLPNMRQFFDMPEGKTPSKKEEAASAQAAREASLDRHTAKFGAGGDEWVERIESYKEKPSKPTVVKKSSTK